MHLRAIFGNKIMPTVYLNGKQNKITIKIYDSSVFIVNSLLQSFISRNTVLFISLHKRKMASYSKHINIVSHVGSQQMLQIPLADKSSMLFNHCSNFVEHSVIGHFENLGSYFLPLSIGAVVNT